MPTPPPSSANSKRLSNPKELLSAPSHSFGDSQAHSHSHSHSHHKQHKHQRHVVGHGRLGARNPSFGRNLSKITTAANKDDDSSSTPRGPSNGSLTSPRPKGHVKRNHSSVSIMPKNASHTALRKNHSSGHLTRNTSAKQLAKSQRPEYHRSHSQPHTHKSKRKHSPAPAAKQPTVHFDVGSEDDGEEMEGVDDGWTEESGSQSPNTTRENTRENTRSNTRSNSVNLDHDQHPYNKDETNPPDKDEDDDSSEDSEKGLEMSKKKEAPAEDHNINAQGSSYQETAPHRPPDAEAIAKRLLQKQHQVLAPPQLSDISVSASTEALNTKHAAPHSPLPAAEGSSSGTPLISRFIDTNPALPGSKDSTPTDPPQLLSRRSPAPSYKGSDMKRNQSTPSFMTPHSPVPADPGPSSGTTTPGGLGHGGRIQQKMWLQRGLSEIESRSQQNLRGMLTPGSSRGGGARGLGAMPDPSERIETELRVVRRYRHPVEESMERLRRLKDSPLRDMRKEKDKGRTSRDGGARTPGSRHATSPPQGGGGGFSLDGWE
ncbi:hypothetical protein K461DRAFT_44347 [Myriangium duriaei CBS 260.36]|uniref:Uncharacterized protein n=1 Tax=Myriangium duriaei CBS 260.36 TaxID=1168546 RepID=A0A9P4IVL5_9PEZI|nr:hypothetical protein K461DRAFT_44347 [Myriangium duriaei CBS 260.36]